MKIKFTRSVLVEGVHRESGTVHDVNEKDAEYCIAAGDATKVTEPEKAKIETAESKQPAKETAARK